MKAIILAGGSGSKLKAYWAGIPKCMLPLFDRPAIERLIDRIVRSGITDIYLCLSKESPEIPEYIGDGSKFNARIAYSIESEPLGSSGAVCAISHVLTSTFLVVQGDCATDVDFAQVLEMHSKANTISSIVYTSVDDRSEYGTVEVDSENCLSRFIEKPSEKDMEGINTVSTGIYVLEPDIFGSIPPFQKSGFVEDIFPRLLNNGEVIAGIELVGYWRDLGNMLGYKQAHSDALRGQFKVDIPASAVSSGIFVGSNVEIGDKVKIDAPSYIGNGCKISESAKIESGCIIGAGSTIGENTSLKNTILGANSSVGAGANISSSILIGSDIAESNSRIVGACEVRSAKYLPKKREQAAQSALYGNRVGMPVQ